MPLPYAMIGAGVGAYGLGKTLGWWGKDEDEEGIKTTPTMSPEQQKLMGQLSEFYGGRIGEGLPGWEGAWTVPPTAGEEWGVGRYKEAVEGMDPAAVRDWYMEYMAPAEQRFMKERIIPEIREAAVPGGTLRSKGTEGRVSGAWERFGEAQLGRIGETIMGERKAGREALPGYMTAAALPRLIEQLDLTSQIEEFKRTSPELSPILDYAQKLLSTTTMAGYYDPGKRDPIMQLLAAIAPGVGYGMGASMAKA